MQKWRWNSLDQNLPLVDSQADDKVMEEAQNPPTNDVEQPVVLDANTQPILEVSGQSANTNVRGMNTEPVNQEAKIGREGVIEGD